jgi:hypothetical protein
MRGTPGAIHESAEANMRTAVTITTTSILLGLVACTVQTQSGEADPEAQTQTQTSEALSTTPPIPSRGSVYCGAYTSQEEYKASYLEAWYTFSANRISAQQIGSGQRRPVIVPLGKSQLQAHPCTGKLGLVFYTPIGATTSDYVWSKALYQCTDSSYQLNWSTDEAAVTVNVVAQTVDPTNCTTKMKFFWFDSGVTKQDAVGTDGVTVGSGTSNIAKALAGVNRTPQNLEKNLGNNRRLMLNVSAGPKYTLSWDPGGGESDGDPPPPDPGCWVCDWWCIDGWGCYSWCWPC